MAYLTKSNSLRIISIINKNEILNINGELYKKPIYFFSDYEKNDLLGFKELLKNPQLFIDKHYVKISPPVDNFKYVYKEKIPSYHLREDCENLHSNYHNFEIPEEIKDKGKDEIMRFRKWFQINENLLETPDKFVAQLHLAFGVTLNPKAINYNNSGIEEKTNWNLEELEQKINEYLSECGIYFKNSDKEKQKIIRKFEKKTFLAYSENPIKMNDTDFTDDAIKKFLEQYDKEFKVPVKKLLIEYYRVLYNPSLKFEGYLLEQLGFVLCKNCSNKNSTKQ